MAVDADSRRRATPSPASQDLFVAASSLVRQRQPRAPESRTNSRPTSPLRLRTCNANEFPPQAGSRANIVSNGSATRHENKTNVNDVGRVLKARAPRDSPRRCERTPRLVGVVLPGAERRGRVMAAQQRGTTGPSVDACIDRGRKPRHKVKLKGSNPRSASLLDSLLVC